jgi:hypothetical protein
VATFQITRHLTKRDYPLETLHLFGLDYCIVLKHIESKKNQSESLLRTKYWLNVIKK